MNHRVPCRVSRPETRNAPHILPDLEVAALQGDDKLVGLRRVDADGADDLLGGVLGGGLRGGARVPLLDRLVLSCGSV